ncbi:MAG: DUF72 domain-containing protein [Candidatus Aminicenantales bacterium]
MTLVKLSLGIARRKKFPVPPCRVLPDDQNSSSLKRMKVGIKVGCCGFPRSKKGYFQHFKLVEVQQTFYKMPRQETALRWREEVPPDFEFSLKASQIITHPVTSPTYRKAGLEIKPGQEGQYGFFGQAMRFLEPGKRQPGLPLF